MKKIMINHKMLLSATRQSIALGSLKASFTGGNRNLIGFIGEELFHERYPEASKLNSYDYDFVLKGKKIDVKTRIFGTNPQDNFQFTIAQGYEQKCDYYFFCGVHEDLTHGWIFGWLSKDEFMKLPIVNVGEPLPQGGGNYRSSGTIVKISDLNEVKNDN